jgi:hypothetical protein
MQRTHSFARLFAKLALSTLLLAASTPLLQAADASGTWSWTTPGRDGGEGRKSTLKLKVDGEKVTGTISSPGRQGGQARETEITDGKIKGDEISFTVVREFGGNKMTLKHQGKNRIRTRWQRPQPRLGSKARK